MSKKSNDNSKKASPVINKIEVPKIGRPSIVTQEILDKLEYAYALGCTDEEACLHAGIYPSVLYRYQEKCPEFKEKKALLKRNPVLLAQSVLFEGLKGKSDLALKVLERLHKKYRPKQDTKLESDGFESALQALIKEKTKDEG